MIRCRSCGHANGQGSAFCESCGTFLEWTGDAAAPPVEAPKADGGVFFTTDHAVGETGLIRRPAVPPTVEDPSPPDLITDPSDAGVVPAPPEPPPGPPPPPSAGTRIDRPPPQAGSVPPAPWAPPPTWAATGQASPDLLRVLARPLENGQGSEVPTAAARPARRARGVEVQSLTDEDTQVEDRPGEPDFGPLLPGAQREFTPLAAVRQAPTRTPQPGDVICGGCGEANLSSRGFCRRCGLELLPVETGEGAETVPPWWRRVLRRRPRHRAQRRYRAGERPVADRTAAGETRTRRVSRRVRRVGRMGFNYLVALLAILALVGTVLPQAAPVRAAVVDALESTGQRIQGFLVPQYVRVNPVGITASSALTDHPPEHVVDGFANTYWAEGAPGSGIGQTVTVTFQEPVQLALIAVLNGGVEQGAEFISQPRPRRIAVQFDDGTTTEVELRDEPDFQEHRISGPDTTTVMIRIISVYESATGAQDASISEIEFLRRF